jgi:hypothetical protein
MLRSNDEKVIFEASSQIRRMLSKEIDPPIDEVC